MLTLTDSVHGVPLRPSAERRWINRMRSGLKIESTDSERWYNEKRDKDWWLDTGRQSLAEFVGDMVFVFVGSLAAGTGSVNAGSASALTAAFAHGLTIALLIISIGHISGGHFNPAVTLGFLLVKAIDPIRALMFIAAQLLGGFIGALFVRLVTSASLYDQSFNGITTLAHPQEISVGEAIACELILTYFLVQTVLCSFVDSDGKNILGALAVGFIIVVDILAGGEISGASMNPARSFGPSIAASIYNFRNSGGRLTKHDPWTYQYVYWAGPLPGAVLAALVYKLMLANDDKRWLFRKSPPKS